MVTYDAKKAREEAKVVARELAKKKKVCIMSSRLDRLLIL